ATLRSAAWSLLTATPSGSPVRSCPVARCEGLSTWEETPHGNCPYGCRCSPSVICLFCFFIPQSPRWLYVSGKEEKANPHAHQMAWLWPPRFCLGQATAFGVR